MRGRVGRPDQAPAYTAEYSIKILHQYAFQSSPRSHVRRARRRCSSTLIDHQLFDNVNNFSRSKTRTRTARLIWARILPRFRIRAPTSRLVGHSPPRPLQPAILQPEAGHHHHRLVSILLRCILLPNLRTKAQARHAVLTLLHHRYLVLPSLVFPSLIRASVLFRPRPVPSHHHHPRPLLRSLSM